MAEAKKGARAAARKGKRRERKSIPRGKAFIKSTFNNTLVTLTDPNGNVVSQASAGGSGFKGSRKSTPFAAQLAGENAARKAMDNGMQFVEVAPVAVAKPQSAPLRLPVSRSP
jgi:small subunit ribosomal protein S11